MENITSINNNPKFVKLHNGDVKYFFNTQSICLVESKGDCAKVWTHATTPPSLGGPPRIVTESFDEVIKLIKDAHLQ